MKKALLKIVQFLKVETIRQKVPIVLLQDLKLRHLETILTQKAITPQPQANNLTQKAITPQPQANNLTQKAMATKQAEITLMSKEIAVMRKVLHRTQKVETHGLTVKWLMQKVTVRRL